MTDESTTKNVNNVYDHELLFFSTYFARKTAFFYTKQKYITVR